MLVLWIVATATPAWAQGSESLRRQVEAAVGIVHPELSDRFYQAREYEPAWIAGGRPTPLAIEFLQVLRTAVAEGFDFEAAHQASLERLLEPVRRTGALAPAAQETLEVHLTDAFFAYGAFLLHGSIDPRSLHDGWAHRRRQADLVEVLDFTIQTGDLRHARRRLEPPYPAYDRLKQALRHYQHLADQGGWKPLTPGPTLRLGDEGEAVLALRQRLHITGDLYASGPDSLDRFDALVAQAVRAFQRRHGLLEDGLVGKETRAALGVPVEARIRQITLNLERLRWLPEHLGACYLLINIAGYSLDVFEAEASVLAMRVIVGKPRTPTPIFSTSLTEVVLAPYWYVPASIALNEILPHVRRDPAYLARNHMRRLPGGGIRQDPGPTNPLGRIKFTIANPYGIGLHDTPERHLFEQPACAFSHGCIRVEKPLELAAYVLRGDTTWSRERMTSAIDRWQETRIAVPAPLPAPLPVHVMYYTAWVDEAGIVQFRPDLYGHDARLERATQAASRGRVP